MPWDFRHGLLVAWISHFGSGSRARRPAGQARGARKSGICRRRATPPGPGPPARTPARWGGGGMPRPRGTIEMTDPGHLSDADAAPDAPGEPIHAPELR